MISASFAAEIIDAEYSRRGYTLGWRLFTCPARNVETAELALITLNPAGNKDEPERRWSVEAGSAYVTESWKNFPPGEERLQRQVKRMFEIADQKPESVLSGYLVPFRSPAWSELANREAAREFGKNLWRAILMQTNLKIIVVFGKDIGGDVAQLLNARGDCRFMSGWGNQSIDAYRFAETGRLIVLPHLSRFALFGRPQSEQAFRQAVNYHQDGPHSGGP
jgi:hypothetical protein